jgi:hypothetical protein
MRHFAGRLISAVTLSAVHLMLPACAQPGPLRGRHFRWPPRSWLAGRERVPELAWCSVGTRSELIPEPDQRGSRRVRAQQRGVASAAGRRTGCGRGPGADARLGRGHRPGERGRDRAPIAPAAPRPPREWRSRRRRCACGGLRGWDWWLGKGAPRHHRGGRQTTTTELPGDSWGDKAEVEAPPGLRGRQRGLRRARVDTARSGGELAAQPRGVGGLPHEGHVLRRGDAACTTEPPRQNLLSCFRQGRLPRPHTWQPARVAAAAGAAPRGRPPPFPGGSA